MKKFAIVCKNKFTPIKVILQESKCINIPGNMIWLVAQPDVSITSEKFLNLWAPISLTYTKDTISNPVKHHPDKNKKKFKE